MSNPSIIIAGDSEPKEDRQSAKRRLEETTAGTFEDVVALSAAIDSGLIVAFTVGAEDSGKALCEVIFPRKSGQNDDEPNPSRQVEAPTPIGALAKAGEIVRGMIQLEQQKTGKHSAYLDGVTERRNLRKSLIATPSPSRN
jgi:hypothetical protein